MSQRLGIGMCLYLLIISKIFIYMYINVIVHKVVCTKTVSTFKITSYQVYIPMNKQNKGKWKGKGSWVGYVYNIVTRILYVYKLYSPIRLIVFVITKIILNLNIY